jgi:hypothetical protein
VVIGDYLVLKPDTRTMRFVKLALLLHLRPLVLRFCETCHCVAHPIDACSAALPSISMEVISMDGISDADQAFLFVLICFCLGASFIYAFWELEQVRDRWRDKRTKRIRSMQLAGFRSDIHRPTNTGQDYR